MAAVLDVDIVDGVAVGGTGTAGTIDKLIARVGEVTASPVAFTELDRLKTVATLLTSLMGLVGEVQASPTANTQLDRLKTLATQLTTLMGLIGEVQANPTALTLLDRAKAIKTSVDAVNTTLASGTVTTLGQTTMTGSLPVAIASDQTTFPVNPGGGGTATVDIIRPGDTVQYTANDVWADSTSAPTAGGFTLTGMGRVTGGSGVITDAVVVTSGDVSPVLQGEFLVFNAAVTAINDNSPFGILDGEAKGQYIGKIPFIMEDFGNQGVCYVPGVNLYYTCVGSANLRVIPRVKNGYVPTSGETLSLMAKFLHTS